MPASTVNRGTTLGSLAAPRSGRRADAQPHQQTVKLNSLFGSASYGPSGASEWVWKNNMDVVDSRDLCSAGDGWLLPVFQKTSGVRSFAATGVTIAGTSCVPAVLGVMDATKDVASVSDDKVIQLWTLRFRMPRSQWEAELEGREWTHKNPGTLVRLLPREESLALLRALTPFALPTPSERWVLHPHLVSILIGTFDGMHPEAALVEVDPQPPNAVGVADPTRHPHIWDGRLLLVAVPPLPAGVEECLTMLTHLETFASKADYDADSGDEFDVPISQIIQDHGRWGAPFEAAASATIAKAFNDQLPHTARWVDELAVSTLTRNAVRSLSNCSVQNDCAALLARYCATTTSPIAVPNPRADARKPPPPPPPPPQLSVRRLDPSDSEDDDASRPAPPVPASLSTASRKRPAEASANTTTTKPAAAAAHKKKKKAADASTDEEGSSSSSAVSEASEEEDDESGDDSDREEDDDEQEDEAAMRAEPVPPPPPAARGQAAPLSAEAAYQLPSHVPDAQRFLDVIDAHRSSFSTTRFEAMQRDACAITLSANPAPGLAEAAAYNRLLGHAVGCLEDVLEERRPDGCVLLPRAEARAARGAAERATQLCEATLPQLDDAIAKLQALRDQGRHALLGVAKDLPPLTEAAAASANGTME